MRQSISFTAAANQRARSTVARALQRFRDDCEVSLAAAIRIAGVVASVMENFHQRNDPLPDQAQSRKETWL